MYEKEYPNEGDLVVIRVKTITFSGAYCQLLEYNKIEGLISSLTIRRLRSRNYPFEVGQTEVVSVSHINEKKGHIDLDIKYFSPAEVEKVEKRWNKSKVVHTIMRKVSKETEYGVLELYEHFGWPLAKKFGHTYDGIEWANQNREEFVKNFNIPKHLAEALFRNIEDRLQTQVRTLISSVECLGKEEISRVEKSRKAELEEQDNRTIIKMTSFYTIVLST